MTLIIRKEIGTKGPLDKNAQCTLKIDKRQTQQVIMYHNKEILCILKDVNAATWKSDHDKQI